MAYNHIHIHIFIQNCRKANVTYQKLRSCGISKQKEERETELKKYGSLYVQVMEVSSAFSTQT